MHAGEQLTPQQRQWDFILQEPNMWRFITTMFRDPARLTAYMASQCATVLVPYPASIFFLAFVPDASAASPAAPPDVIACSDTTGALQKYFECVAPVQLHTVFKFSKC